MKYKNLWLMAVALCTLLVGTACSDDDDNGTSNENTLYELSELNPSTSFGSTESEVASSLSSAAVKTNYVDSVRTLQVAYTESEVLDSTKYYFDADGAYKIAVTTLKSSDLAEKVVSSYMAAGYKTAPDSLQNAVGTTLVDAAGTYTVEVRTTTSGTAKQTRVIVAPIDETTWSFTRRGNLKSDDGFMAPLICVGAQLDVIKLYEEGLGHSYNATKSAPERGVFYFDTGDSSYPYMKYWLDLDTNEFLEESALLANVGDTINEDDAGVYVEGLGYSMVPLLDPDDGQLYYNKEKKLAVALDVQAPTEDKKDTYEPRIQFYPADLTEYLPYDEIEMIWPIMEFNKYTMDEVVELYKKQSYFEDYYASDDQMPGVPSIVTNGKDFVKIYLLEDGGKYAGIWMLARNELVIKSPALIKALTDNGFVRDETKAFPTWKNERLDVEVQIDLYDMLGMGPFVFMNKIEKTEETEE